MRKRSQFAGGPESRAAAPPEPRGSKHRPAAELAYRERHGVEVTTRPPRIAYRETIGAPADGTRLDVAFEDYWTPPGGA